MGLCQFTQSLLIGTTGLLLRPGPGHGGHLYSAERQLDRTICYLGLVVVKYLCLPKSHVLKPNCQERV